MTLWNFPCSKRIVLNLLIFSSSLVEYANEANRIAHYAENLYKLGTRLELSESRFVQYGQSDRTPISLVKRKRLNSVGSLGEQP